MKLAIEDRLKEDALEQLTGMTAAPRKVNVERQRSAPGMPLEISVNGPCTRVHERPAAAAARVYKRLRGEGSASSRGHAR